MSKEWSLFHSGDPEDQRRANTVAALCGIALKDDASRLSAGRLMETLCDVSEALRERPADGRRALKIVYDVIAPFDVPELLKKKQFRIIDGILRECLHVCESLSRRAEFGFSVVSEETLRGGPYRRVVYGPGWRSYAIAESAANSFAKDVPVR